MFPVRRIAWCFEESTRDRRVVGDCFAIRNVVEKNNKQNRPRKAELCVTDLIHKIILEHTVLRQHVVLLQHIVLLQHVLLREYASLLQRFIHPPLYLQANKYLLDPLLLLD